MWAFLICPKQGKENSPLVYKSHQVGYVQIVLFFFFFPHIPFPLTYLSGTRRKRDIAMELLASLFQTNWTKRTKSFSHLLGKKLKQNISKATSKPKGCGDVGEVCLFALSLSASREAASGQPPRFSTASLLSQVLFIFPLDMIAQSNNRGNSTFTFSWPQQVPVLPRSFFDGIPFLYRYK